MAMSSAWGTDREREPSPVFDYEDNEEEQINEIVVSDTEDNDIEIQKREVESGLSSKRIGGPIYVSKQKTNAKSAAWSQFNAIYKISDTDCVSPLSFCQCSVCKNVYSCGPGKGTKHLHRHMKKCTKPISGTNPIQNFGFLPKEQGNSGSAHKPVPAAMKAQVTTSLVELCAGDLRPFTLVEGEGFRKFCKKMLETWRGNFVSPLPVQLKPRIMLLTPANFFSIQIGAALGPTKVQNMQVSELLPSRMTVANNIVKSAALLRNDVQPIVSFYCISIGGGATTDIWTENYANESFICLSFCYINENWVFNDIVLETAPFGNEKKTGINIRTALSNMCDSWKLNKNIVFVTDEGANVLSAIRGKWDHISCACHVINTCLRVAFQRLPENSSVLHVVEDSKGIVTLFKRSELQKVLAADNRTLKQECTTRWLSRYDMLCSVLENFDAIYEILTTHSRGKYLHMITCIEKDILEGTIGLLAPFQSALTQLQASNSPTLHMVAVFVKKIENSLLIVSGENQDIVALKLLLQEELIRKNFVKPIHVAATIFCPKYRNLKNGLVSDLDKMSAHDWINSHMPPPPPPVTVSPSKRSRIANPNADPYDSDSGSPIDENRERELTQADELDSYLKAVFSSSDKQKDILEFWKENQWKWPRLAHVARKVLAVPASSATSERDFSTAGETKSVKRNRLGGNILNDILFLHHNKSK